LTSSAFEIAFHIYVGKAYRQHPEVCVAEIKRFYVALLGAIQQPTHHATYDQQV
jgi:hypothetical protein